MRTNARPLNSLVRLRVLSLCVSYTWVVIHVFGCLCVPGRDGNRAVTGSADRCLMVWDLARSDRGDVSRLTNIKTNSFVSSCKQSLLSFYVYFNLSVLLLSVDVSPSTSTFCSGHQDGMLEYDMMIIIIFMD